MVRRVRVRINVMDFINCMGEIITEKMRAEQGERKTSSCGDEVEWGLVCRKELICVAKFGDEFFEFFFTLEEWLYFGVVVAAFEDCSSVGFFRGRCFTFCGGVCGTGFGDIEL